MADRRLAITVLPPMYLESSVVQSRQPLVSIIIDNYNYREFLPLAISSALGQTYPKVEVVVVDDGSTDGSQSVVQGYGDRVTAILKANGGQASAFNAGFARSSGEIVVFLDSDDILLPNAICLVVDAFRDDPRLAKVHFHMSVIDAEGRLTGASRPPAYATMLDGDLRRHYLTFPDDVWRLPTSGNAFAAAVLRRILPIDEAAYRGGADTYLTHVAPLYGRVRYLPCECAYYRIHGQNNYELDGTRLNLARIRRNVTHSRQTHIHINAHAVCVGLLDGQREILSVSYIINRMISLRLQPRQHPVAGDSRWKLFGLGMRASAERFDAGPAMRMAYVGWFIGMALGPRPLAWRLARQMVFPQTRPRLNLVLKVLGRG